MLKLCDRLKQIIAGTRTTYTLDLNTGLAQVLADGGNRYVYGNNRVAQYAGTNASYFLVDGLGSVLQLADSTGLVTLADRYDPFGAALSSTGSGTSEFGFAGEQTDATGLEYLRARYYAPGQRRFTTKDTWIGDYFSRETLDAWNYVTANPINRTDPSGHDPFLQLCANIFTNGELAFPSNPEQACLAGLNNYLVIRERATIKSESARLQVPWQVTAGVFEAERQIDTNLLNTGRELCYATIYSSVFGINVCSLVGKSSSNPAAGITNIHVVTARQIAIYCQQQQGYDPLVYGNLPYSADASNNDILKALLPATNSIRVMTTYIRILADYRFGNNGLPALTNHSNLAMWTITDAVAVWHGYRYGVPQASPKDQGLGFNGIAEFQNRSLSLDAFINNNVTSLFGTESQIREAKDSARAAVPIFQKYFAMPN